MKCYFFFFFGYFSSVTSSQKPTLQSWTCKDVNDNLKCACGVRVVHKNQWMSHKAITTGAESRAFWSNQTIRAVSFNWSTGEAGEHLSTCLKPSDISCCSCLCAQRSQLLYSHVCHWMCVFLFNRSNRGFCTSRFQKDAGRVTTAFASGSFSLT